MNHVSNFPPEIHSALGFYVYRLIDPRDGSTFYIGKGVGDRVFAHVNQTLKLADHEDAASAKLSTIRSIIATGLEPISIIYRHGLNESEAFAVEAALIDITPGLTNIVSGLHSNDFGPANVNQIIRRYKAPVIEPDPAHNLMLISINKSVEEKNVLDAVRYAWVASIKKARESDYVLAMSKGLCIDVFVPVSWEVASKSNFPGLEEDMPKRIGFIGKAASAEIRDRYRFKRLPPNLTPKRGAANPIRYIYRK